MAKERKAKLKIAGITTARAGFILSLYAVKAYTEVINNGKASRKELKCTVAYSRESLSDFSVYPPATKRANRLKNKETI